MDRYVMYNVNQFININESAAHYDVDLSQLDSAQYNKQIDKKALR